MNENRVPTYGAVVSSIDYELKLKRHRWFKKHGAKLAIGALALLAAAATFAVLTLI